MPPDARITNKRPFNSPVEIALRSLFILAAVYPSEVSAQRLVVFDYLLIHSGDVPDGPSSLHAAVPNRAAEFLIRRNVLEQGLKLLIERDLAKILFRSDGIYFQATDLSEFFLSYLQGGYSADLLERARWLNLRFSTMQDKELDTFMTEHLAVLRSNFKRHLISREKIFG